MEGVSLFCNDAVDKDQRRLGMKGKPLSLFSTCQNHLSLLLLPRSTGSNTTELCIFGPGRRIPKRYSSCSSCCSWNRFSKNAA